MKSILKTFIDYSLFEKYDKEYFVGMCIKSRDNI